MLWSRAYSWDTAGSGWAGTVGLETGKAGTKAGKVGWDGTESSPFGLGPKLVLNIG